MEDYAFFAQTFQWSPENVDYLPWSYRKRLKQAYKDHIINQSNRK